MSDDGYLGSPYRVARVFGAAVPERNPRTRTRRALKLRAIGDLRRARRGARRVPLLLGHLGHQGAHARGRLQPLLRRAWLVDGFVRFYTQGKALFYSDNAQAETTYVSRNRQLSDFRSFGIGGKLSYTAQSGRACTT